MCKRAMLLIWAVLVVVGLNGQDASVNDYDLVSFTNKELKQIHSKSHGQTFSISSKYSEVPWNIVLHESNLLHDDYHMSFIDDSGVARIYKGSAPVPMRGYIQGNPNSQVSLTFNDGYVGGMIKTAKETYYIEPARNKAENTFAIFPASSIENNHEHHCGTTSEHHVHREHTTHRSVSAGDCYEVEWEIVSDFQMFQTHGSISAVENHNVTVANDVQTNYDGVDDFADEVQFILLAQTVFTTANSDPFTSNTDAGTLLGNFRTWGNSNLGNNDVASLWTGRDFDGGTIGIAYVDAICTSFGYNCLQDFSNNAEEKRVMVAHELGHNFGCEHDAQGSDFIMAPSVSEATAWSSTSMGVVEATLTSAGCFGTCTSSTQAPTANFSYTYLSECVVGEVSFVNTSTGNDLSYAWTFVGGNPAVSTDANPTVEYFNAGEFEVILTVTNSGGSDTYTETVEISQAAFSDFIVAVDDSQITLDNNSTGATQYLWDFGDGTTSTEFEPTHTYTSDGTYTVSLTASNACSEEESSETVVISTLPTIAMQATQTSGCAPFDVTFSNGNTENITGYAWAFEGGSPQTSTSPTPTITYSTLGAYDVSLELSSDAGSVSEVFNDYITVNTPPVLEEIIGVLMLNCEITVNGNYDAISIDMGDGNTYDTDFAFHPYAEEGTYIITVTASNECGTTVETYSIDIVMDINENTISNANIVYDNEVCSGESIDFGLEPTFPSYQYQWVFEGGTPSTSTDPNPTVIYENPGTYGYSLTISNSTGSSSIDMPGSITVNQNVDAAFTLMETGALAYQFAPVENDATATSIAWDFGDGATSTEQNPTHTYAEPGTYEVTFTRNNPCGSATTSQTIVASVLPTVSIQMSANEVCSGGNITFTNGVQSSDYTYAWAFEGGAPATSSAAAPQVAYTTPGVYDVSLVITNPSGSTTGQLMDTIHVEPALASYDLMFNQSGGTVSILSQGDYEFVWDFGDGSTSTEAMPTHTYEAEGTYTLLLTYSNSCGQASLDTTIQFYTDVVAGFMAMDTAVCVQDTVAFVNQSSDNATALSWVFEGGSPNTSTALNPKVVYNTAGTYDVTLMASNAQYQSTASKVDYIEVMGASNSTFTYVRNGLEVSFSAMNGATSYTWDFGDGTTSDETTATHMYTEEGTYMVTLTASNSCGSTSTTLEVEVTNLPSADFVADTLSGCAPLTVQYAAVNTAEGVTYDWGFEGGSPEMSTEASVTVIYEEAGDFGVTLSVSTANASNNNTIEEYIHVDPFVMGEIMAEIGEEDNEIAFSFVGNMPDAYAWDFGDNTTSDEATPVHTYAEDGMYTIVLNVETNCGSESYTIELEVGDVAVDDVLLKDLKVYPNPVNKDYIAVESEKLSAETIITVIDVLGVEVGRYSDQPKRNQVLLDIGGLENGSYFLVIHTNEGLGVEKIVVVR